MSLPDKYEENKISPVDSSDPKADGATSKTKIKPSASSPVGGVLTPENHGAIPKLSKTPSSCVNDKSSDDYKVVSTLAGTMESLVLSPDSSDDNICKTDWLKARDSLENLLHPKLDKADVSNSKSTSCTMKQKFSIGDSPHSESLIGATKAPSNSVSKVLAWDPWDKLGRKSKKENKRRKFEKSMQSKENDGATSPPDQNRKDYKSGDEAHTVPETLPATDSQGYLENYKYEPYQAKNSRAVEFTNKVMVVYIKEDKVIGEATEPLKKELEQQIRNKEMRKGHVPDIPFAKKRVVSDWFKK